MGEDLKWLDIVFAAIREYHRLIVLLLFASGFAVKPSVCESPCLQTAMANMIQGHRAYT